MKREFVMLAQTLKGRPPSWSISEKYDGQRALWDGGVSRKYTNVPWSNDPGTCPTGLWSRYGKVIHAPDEWIERNLVSGLCQDGELYTGNFQETQSIVRRKTPDDRWSRVRFLCFDVPAPQLVWVDGNFGNVRIRWDEIAPYYKGVDYKVRNFEETLATFGAIMVPQYGDSSLEPLLARVAEGVMMRNPKSYWTPVRSGQLLKLKKEQESECVILGYTPGLGRLSGMVGALKVSWNDREFFLSGMTDAERRSPPAIGSTVRFRYRDTTNDGIPKEARFIR